MLPKPKDKQEEEKLVGHFLSGLKKLLSQDDNGLFWQPLMQTWKAVCAARPAATRVRSISPAGNRRLQADVPDGVAEETD